MTFLTPLFLLGALAVAIPIYIHLTNREKREIIEFPSLMFLRRIPYRSVRRQRLRHLFLFALRCLALLLLALAFARPFFESPPQVSASVLGPRHVVFLLDNSYSMGYEDRLAQGKAQIASRIQALGPEDQASIVVFADRAEILNGPTSDKAELAALVEAIPLSARTTRFGPGLKLAKKLVDESELPRKEVVLVSDFQRIGFDGEDQDVWLPAGTGLTPVDLSSPETSNFAVTEVTLVHDLQSSGRERLEASARVTYKAPPESGARESRIHLEIDGRSLQSKPISLEPNDATMVAFDPVALPAGTSRGTIRIDGDALAADNAYHFVLSPGQSIVVLSLDSGSTSSRRSFYIERAIAIGDRPSFRLVSKPLAQLGDSDLAEADVVLLNDVSTLSDAHATRLLKFLEEGGGLVAVLGEASTAKTFSGAAASLVPSPLGEPVDRSRDWGGTLSYLDYDSPVFEIFSAPHSGDFSSARFFRYRGFDPPVTEGVLARFDDGSPALVERRIGEGRVLVWTSTLDTFWNDLARQPVFLPFVHQFLKHTASYAEASSFHTVGEVVDLDRQLEMAFGGEASKEGRDFDVVVSSPSSESTVISRTEDRALLAVEEQGFYEVRKVGMRGRSEPITLAVNLDAVESDLARLDPEELVASVTFREMGLGGAAGAATGDSRQSQESRQGYWWFLLAGAFLLLATETVLSNRLSLAAR